MDSRYRILILDDDPVFLELYKEWLSQLPSKPEIHTSTSGARAMALLETEPFRVLICDLKMPHMDGLQVLAIVRRRFPELRTVVMTGVQDEEFRSRAYALGVDLFWLKPDTQQNMQMFLECLESLLGRDNENGFRGIQSKSLMDIIQMECLSRTSTVLRITRGPLIAKLWLQDGELIDAEVEGARGEAAFQRLLSWKAGTFENLPAEPQRERTIFKSVNALLLESAQNLDEAANPAGPELAEEADHRRTIWKLAVVAREGAEFVVVTSTDRQNEVDSWGTQSGGQLAAWTRRVIEVAKRLSDRLEAGPLLFVVGNSVERQVLLLPRDEKSYLVAWPPDAPVDQLFEKAKKLVASWDS